MTVIERPRLGQVALKPSALAMAWPGVGHRNELVAVPEVTLAPGDVLAAVELATVCGSDLHTLHGDRPAATPLVLGHEQVGRIVAIGDGATARAVDGTKLKVGARIVWSVIAPCGSCRRCKAGLSQRCLSLRKYGHERMRRGWELSGGFATHTQVLAGTPIVLVPDELPAEVAAPASCATATAIAVLDAAAKVAPLRGETMVIAGAGMLGLTVAAMASDAGARVIVSDPDPRRRARAKTFGAAALADPTAASDSALSLGAALRSLGPRASRFGVALEASGSAKAVSALIAGVDVGGVVVLAGTVSPGSEISFDPERIVRGLVTVAGVHDYEAGQLQRAVEYLGAAWSRWPFAELVGEIVPLAELDRAFALAATGESQRIGIKP